MIAALLKQLIMICLGLPLNPRNIICLIGLLLEGGFGFDTGPTLYGALAFSGHVSFHDQVNMILLASNFRVASQVISRLFVKVAASVRSMYLVLDLGMS